jgi:hypothetical protein
LNAILFDGSMQYGNYGARFVSGEPIGSCRLRPQSFSKPQPACVPEVLANDYYEACAIRDLSPKASATLARRCLQGMIRDFCGISQKRLIDEINALKKMVDNCNAPKGVESETMDAIDHVRTIGNIGAHMEADIRRSINCICEGSGIEPITPLSSAEGVSGILKFLACITQRGLLLRVALKVEALLPVKS